MSGGPMDDTSASGVQPGDVLAGKYRVDRVLGVGGMGIVVAAHHLQLDERVALKFLLPEALKNPAAIARFVREARAAVKIKSEHVARVSDVGELENGAPYMVMEYLEGEDLDGWLRQRGALPVEQAVDFVLQACVAVAEAHALGIVHRDLKPANLFCVRRSDGQLSIKVLDFGISKLTDASGASLGMTKTSTVMGSPLYMSPEQMQSSKAVDARSDIWALGVVLYELIAGRSPFLGDSVMELAIRVTNDAPPSLRSFRFEAPPALEGVIGRCLEKNPRDRYANVGELAVALLPFASGRSRASVERINGIVESAGMSLSAAPLPAGSGPALVEGVAATMQAVTRTTGAFPANRSARIRLGVLAVVLVGTAVGLVVYLTRDGAKPPVVATVAQPTPETPPLPTTSASTAPSAEPPVVAAAVASSAPANPSSPTLPPGRALTVRPVAPGLAPPHSPATPVAPVPAAPPVVKTVVNCDPPYVINAAGHRVHKPECP